MPMANAPNADSKFLIPGYLIAMLMPMQGCPVELNEHENNKTDDDGYQGTENGGCSGLDGKYFSVSRNV